MGGNIGWGVFMMCGCNNHDGLLSAVGKVFLRTIRHMVLKFCLQSVLQNVLNFSCFPADFCCAEHVNG
jgi:hypothetical protein